MVLVATEDVQLIRKRIYVPGITMSNDNEESSVNSVVLIEGAIMRKDITFGNYRLNILPKRKKKKCVVFTSSLNRAFSILSQCSIVTVFALFVLLLAGCAPEMDNEKSVTLEEPKVSNGLLIEEDDPNQLRKIVEALDAMDLSAPMGTPVPEEAKPAPAQAKPEKKPAAPAPGQPQPADKPSAPAPEQAKPAAAPAEIKVADAVNMTAEAKAEPQITTKLIKLPKLSNTEMNEISEILALQLESELGYSTASGVIADALPVPPSGIIGGRTLARTGHGGTCILRFGYRRFVSQPLQFWVLGIVVGGAGKLTANPDMAEIDPKITKIVAALNEMRANLTVKDLERKIVQLSYVDAKTALEMLKGLGITTMAKASAVPPKIDFNQLPYVVEIEDPDPTFTGLVGSDSSAQTNSKLSMVPGNASPLSANAIASPMTQLLVIFHPAHPEQYSEVRYALDTLIDRPARQIFIEAMVLEISETGLKELGVEWDLAQTPLTIGAGDVWPPGEAVDGSKTTLDITVSDVSILNNIFEGDYDWAKWSAQLRALIRKGKAEILSRPSVLTLNNRQSTIRVGQDIPIAESLQGSNSSQVSFKFQYLPTGILLNIRPRISEDGKEVSMLIDTIVSAKVPNQDLEMRSVNDNTLLASAPTVSTRRVQTYGRIPNNTPLIIGGLVAKDQTVTEEKIPLLGDIPLIGPLLFSANKEDRLKREVIIVITPHVLPEDKVARRSYPKDEDHFDSFGNELFRDSYRIRSEDVFDLTFLLENQRIANYRQMARQVAEKNYRLGEVEPFRSFVRDKVPGESILVTRMIYEVIKRLEIAEKVDPKRIIYFKSEKIGGYDVKWLEALIADETTGEIKNFGDKALAITYHYDRDSLEAGRLGTEPIPEIRLIDCPDQDVWKQQLWELNQPTPDGQKHHTILIQNESDVLRLRRALVLKRIAVLNGDIDEMRLKNFSVGKTLLMPELKEGQVHVIDADTARFFFHTELYYAATLAEIEKQLKELDKLLHQPEINILLDSDPLVGNPAENILGTNVK